MKAWIVFYGDSYCGLFHAPTAGQAKLRMLESYGDNDYLQYRAKRIHGLDDKPITWQNALAAGFVYTDEYNGELPAEDFVNDCRCDICKGTYDGGRK